MRTEILAILPGFLAWWLAATASLEVAFLNVYLPVLLLIPDNFRFPIDGLPDPTFGQSAILPIGIAVCWKAIFKKEWNWSILDACVGFFLVWQFISDFYNVGIIDAQNLGFDMLTLALLPYVCGKALIEPAGNRIAFARRFVWLLFIVALISTYEFRMADSLFRPIFGRFFPGQDSGWFIQIRWGLGRVAGPYGHAILMGCILSIAILLTVWISRCGLWERSIRGLGDLYFTKQQIIMAALVLAMIMTLSRGPWLGAVCGLLLASAGISVNLRKTFKRNLVLLALVGLGVFLGGKAYLANEPQPAEVLTTGRSNVELSEVEQSTAYRAVLFDKYVDIVMQRPLLGWGRANWPQVAGMSSIDNNYLFIALNTGIVGVCVFVLMLLVAAARLVISGFSAEHQEMPERSFHFTLLGIIVAIGITTASVFMGSQLYPLLFLFLGWADATTIAQLSRPGERRLESENANYDLIGVVA